MSRRFSLPRDPQGRFTSTPSSVALDHEVEETRAPKTNGTKPKTGVGLRSLQFESKVSSDIRRLLGVFNPQFITTQDRLLMMKDPVIALCIAILRSPIINLRWSIEGDDPLIRDATTLTMNRVFRQSAKALSMAIPLGHAVAAPEWLTSPMLIDVEDRATGKTDQKTVSPAWHYDRIKPIDIRQLELLIDTSLDRWSGIEQTVANDISGKKTIIVGTDRSILWTFRAEDVFGDLRGNPILDQVYEPWWWSAALQLMANRYFERRADPPMKGRAPDESMDAGGIQVDAVEYLQAEALNLKSGSVIILPFRKDPQTGEHQYDLDFMQPPDRGEMFQNRLDSLDALKMRGCLITDKAATSDGSGSLAMASVHAETLAGMLTMIINDFLTEVANPQMVDPFVRNTFGEQAVQSSRTRMVGAGVSQAEMDRLKEILIKLLDAEEMVAAGAAVKLRDRINGGALAEKMGLELVPAHELQALVEDQRKREEEERKQFIEDVEDNDDGKEIDDRNVADDLRRSGSLE